MSAALRIQPAQVDHWKRLRAELAEAFSLHEEDDALPDTLDGMSDLGDQIHALAQRACQQEAFAEALDAMISESRRRKDRLSKAAQAIRRHVADVALDAGIKTLSRPDMTLSFKLTKPSLAGEADPAELPDEFVRVKREINRTAIKDALDAGREVPGFSLSNGRPSITVRRG